MSDLFQLFRTLYRILHGLKSTYGTVSCLVSFTSPCRPIRVEQSSSGPIGGQTCQSADTITPQLIVFRQVVTRVKVEAEVDVEFNVNRTMISDT